MNNQAYVFIYMIILFPLLILHLTSHLALTSLTSHSSFNFLTNYFCLIKILIGEPVSFQFSRILFSRKRL